MCNQGTYIVLNKVTVLFVNCLYIIAKNDGFKPKAVQKKKNT